MMMQSDSRFVRIIAKIPMFRGLRPEQALEILKAVEPKAFAPKEMVCGHGSKSSEMFILLSGQLAVRSKDGMPLATIYPIVTVGEMGIVTGHPRSATVIAVKQSNTLMLPRLKFDLLLKRYPEVGLTIYRNLIGTLTDRISENNRQITAYQKKLEALGEQGIGTGEAKDDSAGGETPEEGVCQAEVEGVSSVPGP